MKPMRTFGLFFAGLICCGAGNSKVDALLKQAQFAPPEIAKKLADKVLALDPKCGDAYALEGYAKYCNKDFPGAINDCTRAIDLHPKDLFYFRTALNYRYHCYIESKDWKKALADCIECLKVEHTVGVARDAALLCKKTGDYSGFTKYCQLCSQYQNERSGRRQELFDRVRASQDPTKVDGLLHDLNGELKKDPGDLKALSLRSSCYETKGHYADACKDLSRLIAARPNWWPNYLRRARLDQKMGANQKAAQDLDKAKQLGYDPAKVRHANLKGVD